MAPEELQRKNFIKDCEGNEYATYCGFGVVLPQSIAKWAGLKSVDPVVEVLGVKMGIAALNDTKEYSFDQIANIIENQL